MTSFLLMLSAIGLGIFVYSTYKRITSRNALLKRLETYTIRA